MCICISHKFVLLLAVVVNPVLTAFGYRDIKGERGIQIVKKTSHLLKTALLRHTMHQEIGHCCQDPIESFLRCLSHY